MKMPKGYIITYQSWENDGDDYKTHRFEGKDAKQTAEIVQFVTAFTSRSNRNKHGLGNFIDTEVYELIKDRHFDLVETAILNNPTADFEDVISDILWEYFGSSEYFCTRVYNGDISILYNPVDIVLENETDKFLKENK